MNRFGMKSYKFGDVIEAYLNGEVDYFVHQSNCFNTMGSGIALGVKNRMPELYKADQQTVKGCRNKLGKFSHVKNMYNLYGQYSYGAKQLHTNYGSIRSGLILIRDHILNMNWVESKDTVTIGMPKIGCGRGGGEWSIVSTIIDDVFVNTPINVVVYDIK